MKTDLTTSFICVVVIFLSAISAISQKAPSEDPKIEKERADVRKASADTLKLLYKARPEARTAVERAAGYATFSNVGVKILVSGSGRGKGVAINNRTKVETFMKMLELQAGLGFGVKKFRLIFIFETDAAMNKFINSGWEFGGQADAAAKAGEGKGLAAAGAVSVSDGVWLYQLTDKGVALEITVKGSKYYKDDDLNR